MMIKRAERERDRTKLYNRNRIEAGYCAAEWGGGGCGDKTRLIEKAKPSALQETETELRFKTKTEASSKAERQTDRMRC